MDDTKEKVWWQVQAVLLEKVFDGATVGEAVAQVRKEFGPKAGTDDWLRERFETYQSGNLTLSIPLRDKSREYQATTGFCRFQRGWFSTIDFDLDTIHASVCDDRYIVAKPYVGGRNWFSVFDLYHSRNL